MSEAIVSSSAIVVVEQQGQLVVDSRLIALDLDIQHKNLAETIKKYEAVIEKRFGTIAFETLSSKMPDGRINPKPEKFYWLTESQATFLMTLSRNTDRVVECKANLVQAFIDANKTQLAQPQLPQTYLEALEALVASEKAKALLKAEKQELEAENEVLSEAVDELFEYSSIIRIAKYNGMDEKAFRWQTLKAAAKVLGLEVKKVPCPRFQYKLLYPHDAWRFCYPDVRLPETTTLVIKR